MPLSLIPVFLHLSFLVTSFINLNTLISAACSLDCVLVVRDHVSVPYNNIGFSIVLHIMILLCLGTCLSLKSGYNMPTLMLYFDIRSLISRSCKLPSLTHTQVAIIVSLVYFILPDENFILVSAPSNDHNFFFPNLVLIFILFCLVVSYQLFATLCISSILLTATATSPAYISVCTELSATPKSLEQLSMNKMINKGDSSQPILTPVSISIQLLSRFNLELYCSFGNTSSLSLPLILVVCFSVPLSALSATYPSLLYQRLSQNQENGQIYIPFPALFQYHFGGKN